MGVGYLVRKSSYFRIALVGTLLLLGACQTNSSLFGPSEHDKTMARLDAQNKQNKAEMTAIDNSIRQYHEVSSSIRLGQSQQDVLRILSPTQLGLGQYGKARDAFKLEGKTIEIHYMRSARIPDGNVTDDEFVPYSFVDGILTAIGWQSLGGVKTRGDTAAIERRRAAAAQMLLGLMGQQQQQRQHQDRIRMQNQDRMQRMLNPPKQGVECRTQYFGNTSRTVCN